MLAGRVRQGMTPAISALAVIIIAITVTGAIVYEIVKSAEMRREARPAEAFAASASQHDAGPAHAQQLGA